MHCLKTLAQSQFEQQQWARIQLPVRNFSFVQLHSQRVWEFTAVLSLCSRASDLSACVKVDFRRSGGTRKGSQALLAAQDTHWMPLADSRWCFSWPAAVLTAACASLPSGHMGWCPPCTSVTSLTKPAGLCSFLSECYFLVCASFFILFLLQ